MESINAARRTEDIALDLLKFVAAHTNVASKAVGATGFGVSATAKPEEQVTQLLELYARCRQVRSRCCYCSERAGWSRSLGDGRGACGRSKNTSRVL